MKIKLKSIVKTILGQSSRHTWPLANRMIKLTEECGELGEAVNKLEGFLPHKELKEPVEGEVADVIITALDVLRESYAHLTEEQVLEMLYEQLKLKSQKWEHILTRNEG